MRRIYSASISIIKQTKQIFLLCLSRLFRYTMPRNKKLNDERNDDEWKLLIIILIKNTIIYVYRNRFCKQQLLVLFIIRLVVLLVLFVHSSFMFLILKFATLSRGKYIADVGLPLLSRSPNIYAEQLRCSAYCTRFGALTTWVFYDFFTPKRFEPRRPFFYTLKYETWWVFRKKIKFFSLRIF